jgi:catechol 2,3-dioxygenase-like lactoylglutathione lyase family enzyme
VSAELNHTIVHVRDNQVAATWVAELLGLPAPTSFGHFQVVAVTNGVSLDYISHDGDFDRQHYAFLVTEDDFDEIFGKITARGIDHWADPARSQPGQINHHDGGRGVYFEDLDGHFLEIITRPYGSGA